MLKYSLENRDTKKDIQKDKKLDIKLMLTVKPILI